jgi:hypothetical protein
MYKTEQEVQAPAKLAAVHPTGKIMQAPDCNKYAPDTQDVQAPDG